MVDKIGHLKDLVQTEYNDQEIVSKYSANVQNIGLWESEKLVFRKYFNKTGKILDLGCGAGRTTISLYQEGFHNIEGLDASSSMIWMAKINAEAWELPIPFVLGDATNLNYADASFDGVIFSYNGIMQIPGSVNRRKAMGEIRRVLKNGGFFIFTTHDRHFDPVFAPFWVEQEKLWREGKQDERVLEYGDIIIETNPTIFVHIPVPEDTENLLTDAGFKVLKTAMRSELCEEPEHVEKYSCNCRFWIVQ
jgi:ubiquinone/menaquinone biosynthesis C-methylase UbiE